MEGMTIQSAMNLAACGICAGSLIFSWLGINLERDWFLMVGLLACALGNAAFTAYLWEQGVEGERRDAMVALFACCLLLTLYAIYCQCEEWYELGWVEEEEEAEEAEEAAAAAAARGKAGAAAGGEEEGEEGEEGEDDGEDDEGEDGGVDDGEGEGEGEQDEEDESDENDESDESDGDGGAGAAAANAGLGGSSGVRRR